jgi:hypothetical protein
MTAAIIVEGDNQPLRGRRRLKTHSSPNMGTIMAGSRCRRMTALKPLQRRPVMMD